MTYQMYLKKTRWLSTLALCLGGLSASWVALHEIPGAGPLAADSLRSMIGTRRVAMLEDSVYGARDHLNRVLKAEHKPQSYWKTPSSNEASPKTLIRDEDPLLERAEPTSLLREEVMIPKNVGPVYSEVKAQGDGVWVAVEEGEETPLIYKTLLHPDPKRTWAELFVVAIDLRAAELHSVAGSVEPRSLAAGSEDYEREARIPESAYGDLIAAFNGGFKTQHGKFGAKVEGVTLVAPKPHSCTIAMSSGGRLRVGTYESMDHKEDMEWLRQTPGCMVELGKLHAGLAREDNKNWGATLSGQTVIRRSALGISDDGETLYVGISNDTTARSLAIGMRHAGAAHVAQLDVNYSYPKFITYEEDQGGALQPRSLVEGFVFHSRQYLQKENRDFFYLTRKAAPALAALGRPSGAPS